MTDNERAFLVGLEKLTRETGIIIYGCGCCGSPSLEQADTLPLEAGYAYGAMSADVAWISPDHQIDWEQHKDKIVRG